MKKIGVALVVWSLALASAQAQDTMAAKRAMAEELLNLMDVPAAIEKSFAMTKQMIPAQMAKMGESMGQPLASSNSVAAMERMMDMLGKELSWDKMKNDYVSLYAETLSEEELKGLIAFYQSPVGKAFIQKQPELMKRSMELTQNLLMNIMPKIQQMAKEMAQEAAPSRPPPSTPVK